LGEGEFSVFMKTLIFAQHEVLLPHCRFCSLTMGEAGRGQMHKRTTPKIFKRAKELTTNKVEKIFLEKKLEKLKKK
jgi:hypothetical protein